LCCAFVIVNPNGFQFPMVFKFSTISTNIKFLFLFFSSRPFVNYFVLNINHRLFVFDAITIA
jgi:hypothetical protein